MVFSDSRIYRFTRERLNADLSLRDKQPWRFGHGVWGLAFELTGPLRLLLKAQNEMQGIWPHAAMGPVERMVRPHSAL